jgi:hypothetical protein
MGQRKQTGITRVPKFQSEGEAAAFWDSHSPMDYPEEFREVEVRFARPLIKRGLTVKLSEDTISQLRQLASEQGVGPSTLARMWILEHLREQSKRRAGRGTP